MPHQTETGTTLTRERARRGPLLRLLAGLLAAMLVVPVTPTLAVAPVGDGATVGPTATPPEFPAGYEGYHTYAEMVAELDAAIAAHPTIVSKRSIGRSHEGRDIWVAKVSDNVAVDEREPEVLFDALHHGREHLSVEQALALLSWLTDDYGLDGAVTNLVNGREVWIVFMLNPDGGEYDIASGTFQAWRKNRQRNADGSVGTDLNRNYGYRWGCCGGSSGTPSVETYRGPSAWSAPETAALRRFVDSRVVDRRQQIRAHVTLHTPGELILWPYGHTSLDVPRAMRPDDHAVFVKLAQAMAARNGYRAMQSSELYVTDGDQIDWLYFTHRIFSFTFELHPAGGTREERFYPDDALIPRETERNRSALLYLITRAHCPYTVISKQSTYCGPFYEDLEASSGWALDPDGTDTASAGRFERARPAGTTSSGAKQVAAAANGEFALVTGGAAGSSAAGNDLDGGVTSARSGTIVVPADAATVSFRYTFAHSSVSSSADFLRLLVVSATGRTVVWQQRGAASDRDAAWRSASASLAAFAGQTVRLQFEAADAAAPSLVEAGVDLVRVGTGA